jgi:hypothetical protein
MLDHRRIVWRKCAHTLYTGVWQVDMRSEMDLRKTEVRKMKMEEEDLVE